MDLLMPPLSPTAYRTGIVTYELSESLDQYLTAILRMENRHSMARVKDIAGELGFKESSVVGALKKLEALGLIVYPSYRPIHLTDEGRCLAEYIGWRKGILVRFFMTVLHLEPDEAKASASRIGHALKDEVIERMRRFMAETYANLAEPFDVW
ncbi:MAG: metal-dependent transcriptional regulator [Desulfobacteraceae bacterium]|jgi:DtxR family Mn-dependent transcriptional regulator